MFVRVFIRKVLNSALKWEVLEFGSEISFCGTIENVEVGTNDKQKEGNCQFTQQYLFLCGFPCLHIFYCIWNSIYHELEQRSRRSEAYLWNLAIYSVIAIYSVTKDIFLDNGHLFQCQAIKFDQWEGRTLFSTANNMYIKTFFHILSFKLCFSVKTYN